MAVEHSPMTVDNLPDEDNFDDEEIDFSGLSIIKPGPMCQSC